jgi:opacity protein-like surface antigen
LIVRCLIYKTFLYGKLGVGASLGQGMFNEGEKTVSFMTTNLGPYYGGGFQYKLTDNMKIYFEDSGIVVLQKNQGSICSEDHYLILLSKVCGD